jgi:hypothetical protein
VAEPVLAAVPRGGAVRDRLVDELFDERFDERFDELFDELVPRVPTAIRQPSR